MSEFLLPDEPLKQVYLDANATTPVLPCIADVVSHTMQICFGNPSSPHISGIQAKHLLEQTRDKARAVIGAKNGDILFTSGATEGIQTAVVSTLINAKKHTIKNPVLLYGATEHKAVPNTLKHWNNVLEINAQVLAIPVDSNGILDLDFIAKHINNALMICTMAVNNETGVYQDLAAPNNRHVLATINLDHPTTGGRGDLGLYPYMYVRGGSSDIKLDMFNWTPSTVQRLDTNQSWGPGTSPPGNEDGFWGVLDGSGMTNAYNDMKEFAGVSATIAAATPNLYYQADGGNTRWFQDFTAKILIETALLKPLGFSNLVSNSDGQTVFDKTISEDARPGGLGPWEFTIRGDELPEFYTSDNFLIESMTLPLDSYDASRVDYSSNVLYSKETEKRGRRKNILQTIPVNDNTTGLVEYQTNTPIFIDINNKEKMNVKNLDFRILRKDFSTIEQNNEEAILTVLISE